MPGYEPAAASIVALSLQKSTRLAPREEGCARK
jgi:hypothetical protein